MQDRYVVLSGGYWSNSMPLRNILDPRPSFVAEAISNLDWNSTAFMVDLGCIRNRIGLFFFANLHTSSLGYMRLKVSLNSDMSSPTYQTGPVGTWPQDKDGNSIDPWGDWTLNGAYSSEEYEALGMTRFFVPSVPISGRYISVEIMDSGASQPLKIGCFGACEVWESPNDYGPAAQISILDESDITKVPFGSSYVTKRGIRRRFNFGFPAFEKNEMLSKTLGLALIKGKSQPLAVVMFPDEVGSLEKTSLYGLVSSDGVISNPFFGYYAQPIQIDQLI